MKKTFTILNAVLIAATLISSICYYQFGGIERKGLTAFGFVLVGAVNLIYAIKSKVGNLRFPLLMAMGLLFSMIGDVVLNLSFIPGALIFAVGHIFYFAAYCNLMEFKARDLIPSILIFAVSAMIITLVPIFDFGSALMEGICILYALVISFMVGKACSNLLRKRNAVTAIAVVGSILFYFSDLMLVFNVFADAPKITDTLCLFSYFPAQCLLAHSIFQFSKNK